jgi:two-component system, response regulator PdtaR
MHALIIEDEDLIAFAIEEALADLGYTSFHLARTEVEAVVLAEQRRPDVITADVHLLVGSGIGAVLTICADYWIPTVFMTAAPQDVLKRMPDAIVLAKPFAHCTLRAAVGLARESRISYPLSFA